MSMDRVRRRVQQGWSLLEVLITLVVVAVGLLGNATLLSLTLSHNHSAHMRSLATLLSYDIIDCMRANKRAATDRSEYNIALDSWPFSAGGSQANGDLTYWKEQLRDLLPSGQGSVTVDNQGGTTVVIRWTDDRDGANPQSLTVQSDI